MNTELLIQVRDAILAHPEQYNQSCWFHESGEHNKNDMRCNTPSCVAGWAIHLGAPDREYVHADVVKTFARTLLGLTALQGDLLFDGCPVLSVKETDDQSAFFDMTVDSVVAPNAEKTAAVIDHLIATGEVDWSVEPVVRKEFDIETWGDRFIEECGAITDKRILVNRNE